MKRVLVTGANGFIGHHLVRELKKRYYWVRAVGAPRGNGDLYEEADEFVASDLTNFFACNIITRDIDEVFHLAAHIGGIKYISENEVNIMRDNTLIDLNMIENSYLNGVKKFFYSSSACVYPSTSTNEIHVSPIKEEDAYPANPEVGYGWEKIYTEQLLERYRKEREIDIRIARFFSVYGIEIPYKGDDVKSLIALCRKVAEAEDGGEIEIWGDGSQVRCFCYVDDVVNGIMKFTESDFIGPANIGSDIPVSIREVVDAIIKISGKKIIKRFNLDGVTGVKGRNCDCSKAKKKFGWKQTISLEDGIKRTYDWIMEDMKNNG